MKNGNIILTFFRCKCKLVTCYTRSTWDQRKAEENYSEIIIDLTQIQSDTCIINRYKEQEKELRF